MRFLSTAVLAVMVAAPVFGSDSESQVIERVLAEARRWAEIQNAAPVAFASRTTGGAEVSAQEWMIRRRGRNIGLELADAYVLANRRPYSLAASDELQLIDIDGDEPDAQDWSAIGAAFPGTNSLVVLSRPAFDRFQTVALVRADFFHKHGPADTVFYEVERQPAGAWEVKIQAVSSYAQQHSNERHLHSPADDAWYHDRR
jgi:hypothetical protein